MTPEILSSLFPTTLPSIAEIESKYPNRSLPEGAIVSRTAPSPTGFMHIGTVYQALLAERVSHQSGGIFFLRIEDTDQERLVPEAVGVILTGLSYFGIQVDEGPDGNGGEKGEYGPYTQSFRKDIYQAYIKDFVEKGLAYPCFCTHEEVEITRKIQEKQNIRPGYHGKYAKCRYLSDSQILENLQKGVPFVIRLKSDGDFDKRIVVNDLAKGAVPMPENDLDIVIMKQDGLPTYHFAHLVDDHLMHTTHIIRTDEWFSSTPLHLQLFRMAGFKAPQYVQMAPLQKLDNGKKRKLSKRHDPEANVMYFLEKGYPKEAVLEYLLNLINATFEDWRKENPTLSVFDFPINFAKISNSAGALFDFVKLDSISREVISRMTADTVYQEVLTWSKAYNSSFYERVVQEKEKMISVFSIERGIGPKSRKDIIKWSDVPTEVSFFFEEDFRKTASSRQELLSNFDKPLINKIASDYSKIYALSDDKQLWFDKIKQIAEKNGFASDMKSYKANPTNYKGNVSDIAKILRVLVTGRTETPDLWGIMQVLGVEEIQKRLSL